MQIAVRNVCHPDTYWASYIVAGLNKWNNACAANGKDIQLFYVDGGYVPYDQITFTPGEILAYERPRPAGKEGEWAEGDAVPDLPGWSYGYVSLYQSAIGLADGVAEAIIKHELGHALGNPNHFPAPSVMTVMLTVGIDPTPQDVAAIYTPQPPAPPSPPPSGGNKKKKKHKKGKH